MSGFTRRPHWFLIAMQSNSGTEGRSRSASRLSLFFASLSPKSNSSGTNLARRGSLRWSVDEQKTGIPRSSDSPGTSVEAGPIAKDLVSGRSDVGVSQRQFGFARRKLSIRGMYGKLKKTGKDRAQSACFVGGREAYSRGHASSEGITLSRVKTVHFGNMVIYRYPRDEDIHFSRADPFLARVQDSENDEEENDNDDFLDDQGTADRCTLASMFLPRRAMSESDVGASHSAGPVEYVSRFEKRPSLFRSDTDAGPTATDQEYLRRSVLEFPGDVAGYGHYASGITKARSSLPRSTSWADPILSPPASFQVAGRHCKTDKLEIRDVLMGWCA